MLTDQTPPRTVLLASRSEDKAREIREILAAVDGAAIITLDEAGIGPDPAEDRIEMFDSFLANAHAKAAHFMRLTRRPTIADDSGISVDALGGAPGVRSRRFAQQAALAGRDQDRANNERLLHDLRGVPDERRTAHYTCAAVLHLPDGHRFAALGTCAGSILREPRGRAGFGYDPLFFVPAAALSFSEMAAYEKHRFSHRARAFRALAGIIASLAAPQHN